MKFLGVLTLLATVGLSLANPIGDENAAQETTDGALILVNDTKFEETPVPTDDYIYETPSTIETQIKDEQAVDGNGEKLKDQVSENIQDLPYPKTEEILNPVDVISTPVEMIENIKDIMEEELSHSTGGKKNDDDLSVILKDMASEDLAEDKSVKPLFPIVPRIMLRIFNRPLVSKVFDKRMPIHVVINPFLMFLPKNNPIAEYRAGIN